MKVCIVRNAEGRTNAAIARILDALIYSGKKCVLLTRSRYNDKNKIIKKEHMHKCYKLDNYEININARTGRGLLNLFQLLRYQIILFKWLFKNREKYDIVHSFDLDSGLPVMLISKLLKRKYVYHIADFYVDSRGGIPPFLEKLIRRLEYSTIKHAETTIICTEERKNQIKGSKPKELVVVHNTPSIKIDDITGIKQLSLDHYRSKKITFAYVGGLSEKRFIRTVVDTFKNYPELDLQIAGMGSLSNYVEEASQKYSNIKYYGMINYEDALQLYADCDIMFAIYDPRITNHRYSAPNKVYEAMINGKPIIVAKGTSVDKIVEKENMGFIIDYNRESFERVLCDILADRSLLNGYGKNALKAYEKYSWDEMKRRLLEVYETITK